MLARLFLPGSYAVVYKGLDRKAGKLASPFFLPAEHPSSFQGLKNVAVKLYKEIERDLVQGPFLCGTSGGFLMHQGRGCDSILQEKLLD